jgi:nitronate monooxygenase
MWPKIIQGGMGAGVSSWRLARSVSSQGELGVVSGIALDVILARRLQDGDPDGSIRHALSHFPMPSIAQRIVDRYFIEGGRPVDRPYRAVPMHSIRDSRALIELCIAGSFVEVFLARQGHENRVGINFLEKIQLPHLPSIYGAMLAGAAFVLIGAGIALQIPRVLDRFTQHQPATYDLTVTGATEPLTISFDPAEYLEHTLPPLERPYFIPIISSAVLAATMIKRAQGTVDGFVVEAPTAGGHNAPPRGRLQLDASGQPVYGEKDQVDLAKLREMGRPFWLAGGQATREGLERALASGAAGVQVGTAFAFCEESGLSEEYRAAVRGRAENDGNAVFTDPLASPTGFPFKVVELEGSLSQPEVYEGRERICDLGFLRELYQTSDGTIGYRCPSEPLEAWEAKGGRAEDAERRKCLCNALIANIGHPQVRSDGYREPPLLTAGDDLLSLRRFFDAGRSRYTAREVIAAILPA